MTECSGNYILVGDKAEQCTDMKKWAEWFAKNERTIIRTERDGSLMSTVFLGANHNYGEGVPILFETMLFNDATDSDESDCRRYSTMEEAKQGHIDMCIKHFKSYTKNDLFLDLL